jgi:hypothetical protein
MLNQSRTILVAAVALVLSACGADDNEEATPDDTQLDAPITDERRSPEITPGGIEDTPAADEAGPLANTPALAEAASPDPVADEATVNDPAVDRDLPYLPNCWPLHECLIDE